MKYWKWLFVLVCIAAASIVIVARHRHPLRAHAQVSWAQASIQSLDGGMAQYGLAFQNSTSQAADLQALTDWNSYISARTGGWGLSSTNLSRLATADWNARHAGAPQITAQQIANAANSLIAAQLATMTLSQQQTVAKSLFLEVTPKTAWGLNDRDSHVTAVLNAQGTSYVITVSATAFSDRKAYFQLLAPGMVSSSTNFYPSEAVMVAYSVGTADMGFGNATMGKVRQRIADLTGLDMSTRYLYGTNGYLTRRPLNYVTDAVMGQFFTQIGF